MEFAWSSLETLILKQQWAFPWGELSPMNPSSCFWLCFRTGIARGSGGDFSRTSWTAPVDKGSSGSISKFEMAIRQ